MRGLFGFAIFLVQFSFNLYANGVARVEFFVELTPVGSFVGKSDQLKAFGAIRDNSNNIKIDRIELALDTLKTGIALRDEHMTKKYFETDKHPQAVISGVTASGGKFSASLVIRNKTKSIEGAYKLNGGQVEAEFNCLISDFDIKPPKYMGVGVEDKVVVKAYVPVPAAITQQPSVADRPVEGPKN